jgi:hypothetical protein
MIYDDNIGPFGESKHTEKNNIVLIKNNLKKNLKIIYP